LHSYTRLEGLREQERRSMLSKKVKKYDADVVIAGGGPGGCTVAKELAKKGKRVILVEKGGNDTRFFGNQLGVFLKLEKGLRLPLPVRGTEEGYNLILGQGVGGGTLIYAGSAFLPDVEFWKKYGVDMPRT
jgi:choline dehydrogenase-like flavoprotein